MELLIKAREAINRRIFVATIPLCWIAGFGITLWAEFERVYFLIPALFVFCYMIAEDYFYKQVDLRLVGGVLLLLIPTIQWHVFLENLFLGILIFGNFFFTSCRVYFSEGLQVDANSDQGIAFLPSLGIAALIWGGIGKPILLGQSNWTEVSVYILGGLAILLFIFLGIRYIGIRKREKKGEVIIEEGFGLGDAFVCILGFALLGGSIFLTILFIAFLVQLFIYRIKRSG